MKKGYVVGIIVGLHGLVVGSLFLMQGCGTPRPAEAPPPVVTMPPPEPVAKPPAPPVIQPPAPVEPAPPVLETKTYVVRSGDSLSRIAQRFNVSARDIAQMNKIGDPNKIRIGQKLALPAYVNLNAPPLPPLKPRAAAAPKPAAVAAAGGEYVVKAGDCLSKIAQAHGTTTKALRDANSLSTDNLKIGQKLVIPAAAAAPAPATAGPAAEAAPPAPVPSLPADIKPSDIIHVVEPNQDLGSIAMMYGVRAEEIIRLNRLTNDQVSVGQSLKIPPPAEL
jgi:LysM repeat protein